MDGNGRDRREWAGGEGRYRRREGRHRDPGGQQREVEPGTIERNEASPETANKPIGRRKERSPEGLMEEEVHTEDMWRTQTSGLRFLLLLSVDWVKPDSGMNPAEAAEEAPGDPDTDAFYKTGKENGCRSSRICNKKASDFHQRLLWGARLEPESRRAGEQEHGEAERSRESLRSPVEGFREGGDSAHPTITLNPVSERLHTHGNMDGEFVSVLVRADAVDGLCRRSWNHGGMTS